LFTFLSIIHVLTSFALVTAIVLHPAKGTGLGSIGGAAQLFGSQKGAEKGLNQVTSAIGIIWAITAILLAMPGFAS